MKVTFTLSSEVVQSSVHGIFQERILEWISISFSRRSSWHRDWTQVSHIVGRCLNVWATRIGEFNWDDHYSYYCGQEFLRRNGIALILNKRVQNAVLGYSLKNDRMISVCLQGKPFNITVIQVYAPTSNAEEGEVEWFYEDLQDLLELTPK